MKQFYLQRYEDEMGVSGTGRVLEGVVLASGRVVVEWRAPHMSLGIYETVEQFIAIHVDSHPAKTELIWID